MITNFSTGALFRVILRDVKENEMEIIVPILALKFKMSNFDHSTYPNVGHYSLI